MIVFLYRFGTLFLFLLPAQLHISPPQICHLKKSRLLEIVVMSFVFFVPFSTFECERESAEDFRADALRAKGACCLRRTPTTWERAARRTTRPTESASCLRLSGCINHAPNEEPLLRIPKLILVVLKKRVAFARHPPRGQHLRMYELCKFRIKENQSACGELGPTLRKCSYTFVSS